MSTSFILIFFVCSRKLYTFYFLTIVFMNGVYFKNINTVEYFFVFYRVIKGTHVVLFIKPLEMSQSALHTFDKKK